MFDPRCYELAEYFLPREASEPEKHDLAQDIQDAVETWLQIQRDHADDEATDASLVMSRPLGNRSP